MSRARMTLANMALLSVVTGCAPALHSAVQHCDTNTVVTLLDHGANVNETFGSNTLLNTAIAFKCPIDLVRVLLDRGADPNYQQTLGDDYTPLYMAVWAGNEDAVKLLLERGADYNMMTASCYACSPDTPL